MSLEYLVARIKAGLWTFSQLVFNSNRDLPFDDFTQLELTSNFQTYVVGSSQTTGRGDQQKLFVSKSTLMYSDVGAWVIFNSLNNVPHVIRARTWYEFKHNIHQVTVYTELQEDEMMMDLHFEGVMYDEGRRPE